MAKEITAANFETEVLKSEKPILIDFWANMVRTMHAPGSNRRRTGRRRLCSR